MGNILAIDISADKFEKLKEKYQVKEFSKETALLDGETVVAFHRRDADKYFMPLPAFWKYCFDAFRKSGNNPVPDSEGDFL